LAVDFRRIKEAMSSRVGTFWYVVLSFPPTGGHPWRAWRRAQHASNRLLRRASRRFGKFGMIAVWEESAPGRPHLNLVLRHPSISRDSLHAFLRDSLVQCGLGQVFYAEAVESKRAVASYLSKSEQLPHSAPPSWRRMRASKGAMPRVWRKAKKKTPGHAVSATGGLSGEVGRLESNAEQAGLGLVPLERVLLGQAEDLAVGTPRRLALPALLVEAPGDLGLDVGGTPEVPLDDDGRRRRRRLRQAPLLELLERLEALDEPRAQEAFVPFLETPRDARQGHAQVEKDLPGREPAGDGVFLTEPLDPL